jgi:hypothetical protein
VSKREFEDDQPETQERSLRVAIRKARLSQAQRSDVIVDLREAEQARLELLFDELQPVFDEIPDGVEQFECAMVPGDPPRLWVDMLVYVMMGPDKRTYRLIKDLRDGRQVMKETQTVSEMADAVTDYLAHRIIERERALESDRPSATGKKVRRRYSGMAVFLTFSCGFLLGVLCLFILGALLAQP